MSRNPWVMKDLVLDICGVMRWGTSGSSEEPMVALISTIANLHRSGLLESMWLGQNQMQVQRDRLDVGMVECQSKRARSILTVCELKDCH